LVDITTEQNDHPREKHQHDARRRGAVDVAALPRVPHQQRNHTAVGRVKHQIAVEARLRPYVYGTPFLGGEDKVVDMLTRLKANNPRPTDGDIKSQSLLIAGEFPVVVGAYLQRFISMKDKPWGFVPFKEVWSNVPRQGYLVPNGAPHPNAGKLFMWWFVGPEGQALTDTSPSNTTSTTTNICANTSRPSAFRSPNAAVTQPSPDREPARRRTA
jgi:hypothetical protein